MYSTVLYSQISLINEERRYLALSPTLLLIRRVPSPYQPHKVTTHQWHLVKTNYGGNS